MKPPSSTTVMPSSGPGLAPLPSVKSHGADRRGRATVAVPLAVVSPRWLTACSSSCTSASASSSVFPVARRASPDRLLPVAPADPFDLLRRVPRPLGAPVLPAFTRGVALGPEAPGIRFADHRAVPVPEGRAVRLLDGAPGEGGRLLHEVQQDALPDDPVSLADRETPSEVGPRVHGVNAGKPAHIAGHDAIHGEENGRRRDPVPEPEGVAVSDAVRPVADGITRGNLDVGLRAPDGPSHPSPQG